MAASVHGPDRWLSQKPARSDPSTFRSCYLTITEGTVFICNDDCHEAPTINSPSIGFQADAHVCHSTLDLGDTAVHVTTRRCTNNKILEHEPHAFVLAVTNDNKDMPLGDNYPVGSVCGTIATPTAELTIQCMDAIAAQCLACKRALVMDDICAHLQRMKPSNYEHSRSCTCRGMYSGYTLRVLMSHMDDRWKRNGSFETVQTYLLWATVGANVYISNKRFSEFLLFFKAIKEHYKGQLHRMRLPDTPTKKLTNSTKIRARKSKRVLDADAAEERRKELDRFFRGLVIPLEIMVDPESIFAVFCGHNAQPVSADGLGIKPPIEVCVRTPPPGDWQRAQATGWPRDSTIGLWGIGFQLAAGIVNTRTGITVEVVDEGSTFEVAGVSKGMQLVYFNHKSVVGINGKELDEIVRKQPKPWTFAFNDVPVGLDLKQSVADLDEYLRGCSDGSGSR